MFSLVGLPPLAGFVGKFALFASLADGYQLTSQPHLIILLIVGGINTAISLFYYLRVVKVMAIDPESEALSTHNENVIGYVPLSFVVTVTIPVALLIINWNQLAGWGAAAAQQLFG
jgi:NADH-quinone oxidoreductase subunit N